MPLPNGRSVRWLPAARSYPQANGLHGPGVNNLVYGRHMSAVWDPRVIGIDDLDEEDPDEQMGSKDKHWVRFDTDERPWLVKLARVDTHDGTVSGEDWAEWLAQFVGHALGVPVATVAPALYENQRAVLSRSVLRDEREYLIHGNEVLSAAIHQYDQRTRGENLDYTPESVRCSLADVAQPVECAMPETGMAFDAWAGFLLFDALVSGRDRHDENWAIVRRGTDRWLAPSFDHGNSLGFQERDARKQRMLDDESYMMRWLERGSNPYFHGNPKLTDVALHALDLAEPRSRKHWKERLESLDLSDVESAAYSIDHRVMSDVSRRFVIRLLETNQRRLLDGYGAV